MAKAELRVDDEGAVRAINVAGQEFENLSESADEASVSVDELESDFAELASGLEKTDQEFKNFSKSADAVRESNLDLAQSTADVEAKLDRLKEGATGTYTELLKVGQELQEIGEFKAGFIGVRLNEIDELAEKTGQSFQELAKKIDLREGQDVFGQIDRLENALKSSESAAEDAEVTFEDLSIVQQKLASAFDITAQELEDLLGDVPNLNKRLKAIESQSELVDASFRQLASSVNLTAESEEEFGSKFTEVVSGLKDGDLAANDLSNSIDVLSEELEDFTGATLSASGGAESYTNSIQGIENRTEAETEAIIDNINSLKLQEEQIAENKIEQRQLNQVVDNSTGSLRNFAGGGAHVNEILFSTGDAIQDMQFGLRGAGNNLAFMTENFVQAQAQGRSFTEVLSGVAKGLTGPIGVIVGLQTLLALGPQIAQWFKDREEEASDLEESLKSAAESMLDFEDEIAGFTVETVEQAENIAEKIDKRVTVRKDELDLMKQARTEILGFHDTSVSVERIQERLNSELGTERDVLTEIFGLQLDRFDNANELFEAVDGIVDEQQGSLPVLEKQLKMAENMVDNRKAQKQIEELLQSLGLERNKQAEERNKQAEDLDKSLNEVREIQENIIKSWEDVGDFDFAITTALFETPEEIRGAMEDDLIPTVANVDEAINHLKETRQTASKERAIQIDELINDLEEYRKEFEETEEDGTRAFESIKDVQEALKEGEIDTPKKASQALDFLNKSLENTKFESEEAREEIKDLIKILQNLLGVSSRSGEELEDFGDVLDRITSKQNLVRTLTTVFEGLAQSIAVASQTAKSFEDAFLDVLANVASQIGAMLIEMGTSLLISGRVGLGSALIASGISLQALGQSRQITGEGRRQDRRQDRRRGLEGGGEGEIRPGRRRGGPVEAGRMYQTHGLGNREFFVPGVDGQIMTQDQMTSTGPSRQPRTINVITENKLEGSINGPDLFELETRLSEVAEFKEDFAQS